MPRPSMAKAVAGRRPPGKGDGKEKEKASGLDAARSPAEPAAERLRAVFGFGAEDDEDLAGRQRLMNPFEINYSQSIIRPEFQDGRSVVDCVSEVSRTMLAPVAKEEAARWEALGAPEPCLGDWWLLGAPFPEIEVIQWRCKLKKEDGTTKCDAQGNELYGEKEWYTLDNRRLHCLQRAATLLHPSEVRCPVVIVRQSDGSCREFRKFTTKDCGRTVGVVPVGCKDMPEVERWSWRRELGLPDAKPSPGTVIIRPAAVRRRAARGANQLLGWKAEAAAEAERQRAEQEAEEQEGEERPRWDLAVNLGFFVLVYVLLRLVVFIGQRMLHAWRASSGTTSGA